MNNDTLTAAELDAIEAAYNAVRDDKTTYTAEGGGLNAHSPYPFDPDIIADYDMDQIFPDAEFANLLALFLNNAPALIALARLGLHRIDAGISTASIGELAAFQKQWLALALQAGDTITINGKTYTSTDGQVWHAAQHGDGGTG